MHVEGILNACTARYGVSVKVRLITLCVFILVITGQEDNIAVYYQQQVEMLEGFNEMDALADRGFVPGMSKVLIVFLLVFYIYKTITNHLFLLYMQSFFFYYLT